MPGASCACAMARWNMIARETECRPASRPPERCFAFLVGAVLLPCIAPADAAPPYLTGVVEDGQAQTVEMPRLPGSWQRSVEWMAAEGSTVSVGDLIVRLDPGRLIALEEQATIDLEKKRYENERRQAELDLAIMDAETAVLVAESRVRLARIDAEVPPTATSLLSHSRAQLTSATAEQALERARAEFADKKAENAGAQESMKLAIARAELEATRMRDALERTQVHATKAGFLIYAEGEFTGRKVFPGETLSGGAHIAHVASREDLRFRFRVHEADIFKLPAGARIIVVADAMSTQSVVATVDWTSNQATERQDWSRGGYFDVTAVPVEGMPNVFMPGMSVMAEVDQ